MPQLSIVTVYPRDGDPRGALLVSHADWWSGFLVFEGTAELTHSRPQHIYGTALAKMREALAK
ncbi:MAG TPA: hypothetical protein VFE48_14505 [Methylomirabilota bacterium]|nr:hypothetical protein [Methylomirabilota bacterium]